METIEVNKSCGICAHYPNILIHCSVGNKHATKGTSACDKFILHDSYKPSKPKKMMCSHASPTPECGRKI